MRVRYGSDARCLQRNAFARGASDPDDVRVGRWIARAAVAATLVASFWIGGRSAQQQLSPMRVGVDDANIYFRYARNMSRGLGCVWNPGGERVEGCTSVLWSGVCTLAFLATDTPEAWLFLTNVTLAALGAWIVARRLARILDPRDGAVATLGAGGFVAVWIAASPGYVIWMTTTLMDTAVWTTALLWAWSAAISWSEHPGSVRRRLELGAAASLLALGRPEGGVGAVMLLAAGAIIGRAGGRHQVATFRNLIIPEAMLAGTVTSIIVVRRQHFGQWLPNTYYAKVGTAVSYRLERGFEYLLAFGGTFPVAVTAAVIASVVVLYRLRGGRPRSRSCSSLSER